MKLIIFLYFWAKLLKIAHPVNYSYLPPCMQVTKQVTIRMNVDES